MNPLKQEASREDKCPDCGSVTGKRGWITVPPLSVGSVAKFGREELCVNDWHDSWHKGSATAQTPTTKQQVMNAIKAQGYYCCTADFGEHEPTCKNYVGESAPPVETPTKEAYEGMAQGNTSPEPPDTTGRPESTGFEVLVKIHTKDADQKLHSPELLRFLVGKVIDSRYRLEEEIDYTLEVKRVYR